jgi:hypothetical protein
MQNWFSWLPLRRKANPTIESLHDDVWHRFNNPGQPGGSFTLADGRKLIIEGVIKGPTGAADKYLVRRDV